MVNENLQEQKRVNIDLISELCATELYGLLDLNDKQISEKVEKI